MSPTLDENATHDDTRARRDYRGALLFSALHKAIEFDGLPTPTSVMPGITLAADLQLSTKQDVDDWAARLGVTTDVATTLFMGPPPWRRYYASGVLDGVEVEAWCSVPVPDGEAF